MGVRSLVLDTDPFSPKVDDKEVHLVLRWTMQKSCFRHWSDWSIRRTMKKPLILVYFILAVQRGVIWFCWFVFRHVMFYTWWYTHITATSSKISCVCIWGRWLNMFDQIVAWPMVKKNQLSCSRTKHILPKIFITHGLQKIGEVQGTFSNVQIRGSNVCCTLFPSPWFCLNWVFLVRF